MGKTTYWIAAALLTAGLESAALAIGGENPVDKQSNPKAVDFPNAGIAARNMHAPFVRDGVVRDPALFATIRPGLTREQIRSMLGEPLRKRGRGGKAWEYNFQFRLPRSQNFLVCQYKLLFDKQQLVSGAVWRRRQCEQIVTGDPALQ